MIKRAMASERIGPYVLQAAVVAVYAEAPSVSETDWARIVTLYDDLVRANPSPEVTMNRAFAFGMRDRLEAGLRAGNVALEPGGTGLQPRHP